MDTVNKQAAPNMERSILPGHYLYSDVALSIRTPREQVDATLNFPFKSTDIVLATFPRSGTLLTQEIIWQLKNRHIPTSGVFERVSHTETMLETFPYIEQKLSYTTPGIEILQKQADAGHKYRLIKTHLPWFLLKEALKRDSTVEECSKVVIVIRNPKDVAVSLFHFYKSFTCYESWPHGNWAEFLTHFNKGSTMYGDYFDWHLGWYNANYPKDKILYIRYEDIIKTPRDVIAQLVTFLDEAPLTEVEMEHILSSIHFEKMFVNPAVNMNLPSTGSKIMRKGIVGEWREMFTENQNDLFDEIMKRRLHGSSLKCYE